MIDGEKRQSPGQCNSLGHAHAHNQPARKSRASRSSDGIKISHFSFAIAQSLGNQLVEMANMGAGRHFRHDAAVGRVIPDLTEHDIAENLASSIGMAAHHGGSGFIAGGFNAQNRAVRLHEMLNVNSV